MFAAVKSMGLSGLITFNVVVEADINLGLPQFEIVGLPDIAVKEARDRVRSAAKNSGFNFPVKRIVVNLAPGSTKKYGSIYDLAILVAILKADNQLSVDNFCEEFEKCVFFGELSLSGEVLGVSGILPMCLGAKDRGLEVVFVPYINREEAALVRNLKIYPVSTVKQLISFFDGRQSPDMPEIKMQPPTIIDFTDNSSDTIDFSQVKGQYEAKRALEICAAGGHNALLIGPPGSGKSMLAKRINSILPSLTFDEVIEVTKIYSILGELAHNNAPITKRPFRSPHHTISPAGLVGGGSVPRPGELSLAHNGVLFLDELPEFARSALEVLRQPIEDGVVTISRVRQSLEYPCNIMLICAMNPCPCGYFGHPKRPCTCSQREVSKYLAKISGPLLERIDVHIDVPAVEFEDISSNALEETSDKIKERVKEARKIQSQRYKNLKFNINAKVLKFESDKDFSLTNNALKVLKLAFDTIGFSARAYEKILRISRTIADLDSSDEIKEEHISEAIQYRTLDRKYWLRNC